MDAWSYVDFDRVNDRSGGKYRSCLVRSPAGLAAVGLANLFSLLDDENFVLPMARPKRGMPRIVSSEVSASRTLQAGVIS